MPSNTSTPRWLTLARGLHLKDALFSHRPAWAMMPGFVAGNFADSLLFVLALFDELGIEHFAHYGTLLGAARLGGVAPWDEDADIFVNGHDFASILALTQQPLAEHGFEVVWTERRDALLVRQVPWLAGQGHIGISLMPGVLSDDDDPARMDWDAYMRHSELYPLRRYAFHGSYVTGPATADPVLARAYGEAASEAVMQRFRTPLVSAEQLAFWQWARPLHGESNWPAISQHFRLRAKAAPRHALTFPFWWFNGSYNIGVKQLRRLGLAIERRALAHEAAQSGPAATIAT